MLFKQRPIYEQSATRTVREQQENRTSGGARQPLKIEQLRCDGRQGYLSDWPASERLSGSRLFEESEAPARRGYHASLTRQGPGRSGGSVPPVPIQMIIGNSY
jgi:hypothetical protein